LPPTLTLSALVPILESHRQRIGPLRALMPAAFRIVSSM